MAQDYPLENLGFQRFQRVCQALLAKEFPSVRLMPLTNQDGGRDAFVRRRVPGQRGLVVFQVKYSEAPDALTDPRKWVLEAIEGELPKIKKLIPRGLEHYRLITNVRGSAHLDSGSVDKLDGVLEGLPCPADGWWRDDLLGRLDDAWDIKWAFPELFTGPDLLRAIIASGLGEDKERRGSAISAFLADQYDEDARVKFKQVELENRLLDLYVDVELTARAADTPRGRIAQELVASIGRNRDKGHSEYGIFERQRPSAGAADFLLAENAARTHSWVVIEGAPGQGKSTVTQYVCQIHRMRLLGNAADIAHLPDGHGAGPLRLPFRADLRHLAAWLHGRNPFGDAFGSSGGKRTLETFFAAQVELTSGGAEFSVADLHATARVSSLLLVFDGLDEVADIEERRVVVREVTAGLRRLTQISPSLQAIVTSRPAAFENSPGFAKDTFDYLELVDLSTQIIEEYATRWIEARGLRPREASAVRTVLRSKLDQPHMRDLARNPMQLAILLSLINRRGPSLPDKRTALYDSYVSTFFDREAEKTEDVQQHRDLLLEIHQYLAWRLHADAEKGRSQGSVSEGDLRILLTEYLSTEEKDPSLVDVLFKSLVERVVAIVSRVQGTYEFEVQPLREYFAARYLYDTAHYSPAGAERSGDKPDRFDAIARNFYWLNVTRFFAGCFSKGELPSLAEQLHELANDESFGQTDQSRLLATMLLSDWVFAQHPKSVKSVVDLVLRTFGDRGLASALGSSVTLPPGNGREELAARCWELTEANLGPDRTNVILRTLSENSEVSALDSEWLKRTKASDGPARVRWLKYGQVTGSLHRTPPDIVAALIPSTPIDATPFMALLSVGHGALVDQTAGWAVRTVNAILDGALPYYGRANAAPTGAVDALHRMLGFLPDQWEPLSEWWDDGYVKMRADQQGDEIENCWAFLDVCREQMTTNESRWVSSLSPWNAVVESMRDIWGERWVAVEWAVMAAGIQSASDKGNIGRGLFDREQPLCERARYARLRAGASKWWGRRLAEATTRLDESLAVTLFFSWASMKAIASDLPAFDAWLATASDRERHVIQMAVRRSGRFSQSSQRGSLDLDALPASLDPETVVVLAGRVAFQNQQALVDRYLDDYRGSQPAVLQALAASELLAAEASPDRWPKALAAVRRAYASGVAGVGQIHSRQIHAEAHSTLPYELAQGVVTDASGYPLSVVDLAESICRREVGQAAEPVADIASRQYW